MSYRRRPQAQSSSVLTESHRRRSKRVLQYTRVLRICVQQRNLIDDFDNHVTHLLWTFGWNRFWICLRRYFSHREHILCKQVRKISVLRALNVD
jgi:hypothetical protein